MDEEKLNAVMQQLADQMREYNDNLSRFARTTSGSDKQVFFSKTEVDELSKSMANLKNMTVSELEALKGEKKYRGELTDAIKNQIDAEIKRKQQTEALSNATKSAAGGLMNFSKALLDSSADVNKFNSTISGFGDQILTVSKHFGVFGQAIGLSVKALTSLTTAALNQTTIMVKAFDELSEVGATTFETTESIRKLGRDAGYSGESLLKITGITKTLGTDLMGLGEGAGKGAKTFLQIASVGNKTYEAFNRLGLSQEQVTQAQAAFVRQSNMANAIGRKTPEELRKASLDYLDTLVKLRDLTGMSVEKQQAALDAAQAQENFNTYINTRQLEVIELDKKIAAEKDENRKRELQASKTAIENELKQKNQLAIMSAQLGEKDRTAFLQAISTSGETVMTEGVARLQHIVGVNVSEINRAAVQNKDALGIFVKEFAKAPNQVNAMFGELISSTGDQGIEMRRILGVSVETQKFANQLNKLLADGDLEKVRAAIDQNIASRKNEGKIINEAGELVADGGKNTQNAMLTAGREFNKIVSDATAALNPFTSQTTLAAAASTALMLAASGAAGVLGLLASGKILGGIRGLLGGAVGASGAATASGAAAVAAGGSMLGRVGGFAKGLLGKAALPILAGTTLYDAAKGFTADPSAGFGSKLLNAGSSALSGLSFGMLGSSPEEIKKRAEASAGKLAEGSTTTTAEGGQKAVNVNIVGSVPINVNIEKVLDPLFRMAQTPRGTGPSGEPLPPGITVPGVTKSFEQAPATGAGGAANTNITIPPIDKSKPFEGSQKEFTDRMQATLLEQAKKLNLPNAEIIARLGTAQSALETGYGKSLAGGNNYFGIKAKPGDTNASVVNTQEYDPKTGQYVTTKAGFRRYGSMEESAEDYIKFLLENPRYKEVLASKSAEEAVRAIQTAGYATDPRYETKLRGIMGRMGGSSPTTAVATGAPTSAPQATARPAQRAEEGSYNVNGKMVFYKRTPDGKCYINGKEVSEAEYNSLKETINKDLQSDVGNIASMTGNFGAGSSATRFSQGGMIFGPGTSTSDSVPGYNRDTGQPIALSTGEYVLPASVTSMLGRGYLDSLISSPNTLKRQGGGSIPGGGGKQVISATDLGGGMREVLYSDGSRELSGGFGTRFFDSNGKLVKTRTPNIAGLYKEIHADGGTDTHYAAGPMSFSQYASGRKSASYDMGLMRMGIDTERGNTLDVMTPEGSKRINSVEQINKLLDEYKNNDPVMLSMLEGVKEIFQQMMDKNESLFTEMNNTLKDVVGELEESNSTQEDILSYSRI